MANDDIKSIENKLKKSFSNIKEDMTSLKESIENLKESIEKKSENDEEKIEKVEKEISEIKARKDERKDESENNEKLGLISRSISDLAEYISDMKGEISQLKKQKPAEKKDSEVKNIVEFSELRAEISELKYLIENIKLPQQYDYSQDILELKNNIKGLEDNLSKFGKEIKSIKIPQQYDYSQDINQLARELGEIKGSQISRKHLDKEILRTKQDIDDKIVELEEKQQELENSIEQKTRQPIVFSLKNEVKELKNQIEEETEKYEKFLLEIKEGNRKLRGEVKSENEELKNQITAMKSRITRLSSRAQEKAAAEEPFRWPKLNKKFLVILTSIILVMVVLGVIIFFVNPTIKAKYEPLDVIAKNTTGLPMEVYLHQNRIFTISGWESQIDYSNKIDRIAGNNATGWFFEDQVVINEGKTRSNKYVSASISNSSNNITNAQFNYTLFKNKPYFKVQLSALAVNNSKLGPAQYGFITRGYDVYLQNGTKLINNYELQDINGTAKRIGAVYQTNQTNYEILFNSNNSNAVILYSKDSSTFINNFYWNVFWVYGNQKENSYSPIYVIVLEDANLTFLDGKWQVTSKDYSGDLEQYLNKSVLTMS